MVWSHYRYTFIAEQGLRAEAGRHFSKLADGNVLPFSV